MGRKFISMSVCLAGCFGLIIGIAGLGTGNSYADGNRKLAAESTVFDLNASTTAQNPWVFGYVVDKSFHVVEGSRVTLTPAKGSPSTFEPGSAGGGDGGYYTFYLEDNMSYTLQAKKSSLGLSKKVRFKVKKDEKEYFAINLQFNKLQSRK